MLDLILASASAARQKLLHQAGVVFKAVPADLDEAAVKEELKNTEAKVLALTLAQRKAASVAAHYPQAAILAADQLLEMDGIIFNKPKDRAAARTQLQSLRSKTHKLINGVSLYMNGEAIWSYTDENKLKMRDFSDALLDAYLEMAGDSVCQSVGGYKIEGMALQFFEKIEGDYFSILGLPLLPILEALREYRAIPS